MEQTAVEYAIQGIEKLVGIKIARDEYCIQEANIIFEQQIKHAYRIGYISMNTSEQYYNETFKSE